MSTTLTATATSVSEMAEHLIGSEIIKLANEINEKIKKGEKIYNLTIGDFDPKIFPIPSELLNEIINAYKEGQTNYPVANGMPELRKAVSGFIKSVQSLDYTADEVLISGGARPLIYGIYKTLIDPGDKVIFPVPSWNNNHYCHLSLAKGIMVETQPENNFMPTVDEIRPFIKEARMIALCSPLNPTGTIFAKFQLEEICDMLIEENKRREGHDKPLYLLYDQIYSVLTFGTNKHYDPVSLRSELRDHTVFVDGISKSLAATGIRVGWSFGPKFIIDKMKSILSHVGAWAPKAEQIATAKYLSDTQSVNNFLNQFKNQVDKRLNSFYKGFMELKNEGHRVNAIVPQAAIYLTVQIDLVGKKTANGNVLKTQNEVTSYLVDEAKMAIVPFSAFGSSDDSTWYRLSVGTCKLEEVDLIIGNLRKALLSLK
jgi:aspartate aminotransferase